MGLDRNVWIVMGIVCLLSTGLLGYTYINGKNDCTAPEITINAMPTLKETDHFVNEPLTFKVQLAGGKKITWDFGDKSSREEGFIATHTFKNEGRYNVTATVNGLCENVARVHIKKMLAVHQDLSNISISERISGNLFPFLNKEEVYSYTGGASAYEWTVKNSTNFSTQTGATATFKFPVAGTYTIQLVLNNDPTKKGFKEITVVTPTRTLATDGAVGSGAPAKLQKLVIPSLPPMPEVKRLVKQDKQPEKQPETQPEKQQERAAETTEEAPTRRVIFVRDEQFKSLLEAVITGQKSSADFDKYLVNGGDTKVRVNDGKTYKTFAQFCQEIKGKKIVINSVELKRDENNAVQQISIDYKKKGLFG